jgi:hypothetical protein
MIQSPSGNYHFLDFGQNHYIQNAKYLASNLGFDEATLPRHTVFDPIMNYHHQVPLNSWGNVIDPYNDQMIQNIMDNNAVFPRSLLQRSMEILIEIINSVVDRPIIFDRTVPLLKSRPHHAPLSLTGAKDPLLWSGTDSDPHVSKPTFRAESDKACSRDLNRPSSRSTVTFVSGQAKSGAQQAGLWRAIIFQGFGMAKM